MICSCTLAGTAACASCLNNPNSAKQYNNFKTWTSSSFITWTNNIDWAFYSETTPKLLRNYSKGDGRMSEYIYTSNGEPLANERGEILLARAGEIVRCRDCVHYKPYRTNKYGMMNRCHDEHGHTHKRDESDFCSRGEMRNE